MNKFYITTSIPYVNADPHIGFAMEAIQTDAQARFQRLVGKDVRFLSGTDENALKNVQAAEKASQPIKEFIDERAANFSKLKDGLNLSWDDFIRTTEDRHVKGAQKIWLATKKEDIYKKKYKGLYCVGCETFYEPDELNENGECFEHPGKKLELVEEENYFFKLSSYQAFVEQVLRDKVKVFPETRKNEVLAFVKKGLQDFSISRTKERAKGWGIEVPGDPNQVMYVWYDALTNYISALGYADNSDLFKKFWLENNNKVHVIGKGISRFHAIYWLAMLESAGLPLPNQIFVHGYVTSGGQKISKSLGNVIDPFEQINKYGTDAVRYFLLREIPSYGDGDYTEERFREVYNSDLANGLGNLVARVAKLCERLDRYEFGSLVEKFNVQDLIKNIDIQYRYVENCLNEFRFDEALAEVWRWLRSADKEIESLKPWTLNGHELQSALDMPVHTIIRSALILQVFLPETARRILDQFKGQDIASQTPLFPRIK